MTAPATRWTSAPAAALAIVLVALATRFVTFGNPVVIIDDQFYHYVGSQILEGRWPYTDLWDRKPIGLFLLFAGIAAVGGGSVVAMQLVATLFAAATAWLIRHIALFFASPGGALLAALAYLLMLPMFGGQSGQSPVFYNLIIAGAAALLLAAARQPDRQQLAIGTHAAMLLCGLALIIKQSSLVEGIFIGLGFLWLASRRGAGLARLAAMSATMVALALLPSLIALAVYAARGNTDDYLFANYVSIFLKEGHSLNTKLDELRFFIIHMAPLAIAAIAGAVIRRRAGPRGDADRLLVGWMIAALGGYAIIPNFFDHYALPLLPPLALSAASLFALPKGRIYFLALAAFCLIRGPILDLGWNRHQRDSFARADAAVHAAARGGCAFVVNGPTQFFFRTPPCPTTRYIFPDHLTTEIEAGAIGVDQRAELVRVLAARPAVIVMIDNESDERPEELDRLLYAVLERDYRSTFYLPDEKGPGLMQTLRVWQRRDLLQSMR